MHANEKLIRDFYAAFARKDWEAMAACYHPEIHFTDAVFDLKGKDAGMMWRMLLERGKDLEVTLVSAGADSHVGSAFWEARYTFTATKKKVLNRIHASFKFRDGKIVRHEDSFDFWTWSGQALGIVGKLFGWAPPLRAVVSGGANKQLQAFIAKKSAPPAAAPPAA